MSRVQAVLAALIASSLIGAAAVAGPPSFTITTHVEGAGTILLDPQKDAYKRNNIVNVTAMPSEGWRFDHWQGDLAGDTNPTTIRVAGDHLITAVFVDDGGGTDPPGEPRPEIRTSGLIVGYFVQWGIYRRDYVPADIVSSGTATNFPHTIKLIPIKPKKKDLRTSEGK